MARLRQAIKRGNLCWGWSECELGAEKTIEQAAGIISSPVPVLLLDFYIFSFTKM